MVPQDDAHPVRGKILHAPFQEVRECRGLAHIGLPDLVNFDQLAVFYDKALVYILVHVAVVPEGASAGLDHIADLLIRRRRLHLFEIICGASALKHLGFQVRAAHIDEDRPASLLAHGRGDLLLRSADQHLAGRLVDLHEESFGILSGSGV